MPADNDGKRLAFVIPGYAERMTVAYQRMREDLFICIDTVRKLLAAKLDDTIHGNH